MLRLWAGKLIEIAKDAPFRLPFEFWITKATQEESKDATAMERYMGGILTTPRKDLQGQYLDAALIKDAIDFSEYKTFGRWVDTHKDLTVGYPLKGDKGLKMIKGKGWYTEGRLLPDIGAAGGKAVERANYFWGLALALKAGNFDRSLGLSVEGKILEISPCGRHILKASVRNAAVCEVPINPDCRLEILQIAKAFGTSLECDCDHCRPSNPDDLIRALDSGQAALLVKEDLEGAYSALDLLDQTIKSLSNNWEVSYKEAKSRLDRYLRSLREKEQANGAKKQAA